MLTAYFHPALSILSELLLLSVLLAAAHSDYKTQTVPWLLLPVLYPVLFLHSLINKAPIQVMFDLLGTATVFLIFYMNARLLGGGGGDALFLPAIPFQHGLFAGLLIILSGCLWTTCGYICTRVNRGAKLEKHASLPLIPGVFFAYTIFLFYSIWRVVT